MAIMIRLSPDKERRLAERAAQTGQDVEGFIHRLIEREIQDPTSLDEVLAPVRRQFERSGMTDEDLADLVEEAREEVWREKHDRPGTIS